MIPAPTNEMAIGMKISDLEIDSRRMRSSSRARVRPSAVDSSGAMMIHRAVLTSTWRLVSVVKIQMKLLNPTKFFPLASWKLPAVVRIAGTIRP